MAKGRHSGGVPPLEPGSGARAVALRVPPSLYRRLETVVAARGVTPSQVIRDAITAYLDQLSSDTEAAA